LHEITIEAVSKRGIKIAVDGASFAERQASLLLPELPNLLGVIRLVQVSVDFDFLDLMMKAGEKELSLGRDCHRRGHGPTARSGGEIATPLNQSEKSVIRVHIRSLTVVSQILQMGGLESVIAEVRKLRVDNQN